jgi:hypothetical protein
MGKVHERGPRGEGMQAPNIKGCLRELTRRGLSFFGGGASPVPTPRFDTHYEFRSRISCLLAPILAQARPMVGRLGGSSALPTVPSVAAAPGRIANTVAGSQVTRLELRPISTPVCRTDSTSSHS